HFNRVAVDVAEGQILSASGEHGDAITLGTYGSSKRSDEISGKLPLNFRRHRFEFRKPFGEQLQDAASANQLLQTESLIEAHEAAHETQSPQIHEQPAQCEIADESSPWRFEHAAGFGFSASVLE